MRFTTASVLAALGLAVYLCLSFLYGYLAKLYGDHNLDGDHKLDQNLVTPAPLHEDRDCRICSTYKMISAIYFIAFSLYVIRFILQNNVAVH